MPNATCPSEEELALYTVGRMPLDHVEEIAEHIDQCPDCQAALVELPEPRDSLVEQIREPAPAVEPIEDPACLAALSRAKALMSESAAINGDETIETRPPDAVRTLGEYELLAKLGEGGMGAVYRARHTKLQRIVALKLLSKHRMEDERAVARFEREMAAVGQLTHPNVVQAHDAREIDGTPILGMEYVEGVDLSKLAARVGPLPVTDACEIVRQAAVGLQAIHEHGLVHRDVKPSNLMLTPEGQVKILDLGLARLAGEGITATLIAWQITVRIRRPDGTEQIVEAPAKSQVTIEHRQSTAVDDQTRPPTHTQRVSTEHSPLDDLEGDVMEVGCFEGHRDAITDVEFWPDEKTLASASCDGTVRLWDMVTGEELKRIRVDNGDLKDVAFCSDGRHFAAANGGMTAQLWDIESEKLVRHFEGHSDGVDVVSFLPDGNRVVSGSGGDRTIRVWDVATGRQVRQFTQQESKTLRVLSASPDGRHLAVARDGEDCVHLYALDGLIPPQVFDCGQRVYSVSFSPDGTAILATGSSPHPKLIDLATGELLSDMPLPQDVAGERYHYGTFDPTGRLALVASQYGLLRLWDSGTRRLWQSQPLAHITPGSSLSRDGSLFATGDEYGYVRIFMLPWPDASFPLPANNAPGGFETHDRVRPVGEVCVVGERSGMPAFSMPAFSMSISERLFTRMDWRGFLYVELGPGGHVLRRMHLGGRHNGCLSPDGQSILCWGNGRLFMVNTITGRETWSLQGFGGPGSFSPNDSLMLALQNNQPIVLDATSGAPLCTMEGASGSVSSGSMIVSPNGRYAAVAGCGGIPMLWKMPATIEEARLLGRAGAIGPLHILGTKQYNHVSCRIAFSADSRLLAVAGPDEMVCVWNVASGVEQSSFSAHEGGARAVAIAPDGGRILTGGEDGTIILWNADNTTEVLRLRGYHTAVNKLAFSADGRFAVSAANDASVRIWRLPPADEQGPFEVEVGEVGCLYAKDMRFEQAMLFSDGRRALETTKINEQTLTLWDVETGSEVRRFEGHTGDLTHLAVSPDEDLIVAADGEQVLAWKTETGELVHRFRGGGPFAFTPDGKTLFGGGDKPDGTRKSTDAADIHQDRAKGTGGSCWPGFDAEARLPSPFASHINRSLPLCRTSVHTETSIRHHTSRQHTRRRRRRNCPQLFRLLTPFAHLLRYARMVRDVTILQILTGVKKVSGTFCAKHLLSRSGKRFLTPFFYFQEGPMYRLTRTFARPTPTVLCLLLLCGLSSVAQAAVETAACKVLADDRLVDPLRTISGEYTRRTQIKVTVRFLPETEVNALVQKKQTQCDVVLCMPAEPKGKTAVESLPGARAVAWKYPSAKPVWAAVVGRKKGGVELLNFVGGPTGHRLWSESEAGFTITTGKTHAEAFDWVVKNRVGRTYPITAMRMLSESGGVREGICIDIGCGTGNLDVELAKRSNLTIIGLDIDADMKPLFEKRINEAGLQDRASFVQGDAQELPFDDDYADLIVSRGTLTFIPDIAKCLREVERVLKPTGVAFLGGRYVYTPQKHKISTDSLREIVAKSGVARAQVIDARGQWVKILGPRAPEAARRSGLGPHMLAARFIADYAIAEGKCLLICTADGGLQKALQRGFVDFSDMEITALYPTRKVADEAAARIALAKLSERITCKVGNVLDLPFEESSFDAVAGVGPILLWGDREKGMSEVYRVLRPGGAALVGGKYLGMPQFRKVSSETLRASAAKTGIPSIRVVDNMGQWVEILKGTRD